MTSSPVGARWVGHPLLSVFSGQRNLSACVRFVALDKLGGRHPLPAGISVRLVHDSNFIEQLIDSSATDSSGKAFFNVANLAPPYPDMYFVADIGSPSLQSTGITALPQKWSTEGWYSADGKTPGYNKDFAPSSFGSASKPIEFEVGVNLFLKVLVEDTTEPGLYRPLLPGTKVTMRAIRFLNIVTLDSYVDDIGIVHFQSFDIVPNSDVTLTLYAESNSPTKHPFLNGVYVSNFSLNPAAWQVDLQVGATGLASITRTSFGASASGPHEIKVSIADKAKTCAAFTILRNLSHFNSLIHHTAPSDWSDCAGQFVLMHGWVLGGISLPDGSITLPASFNDWREGQIHEFAHQLLWKLATLSTAEVLYEYCLGDAHASHEWLKYYNNAHALLEGYAEAFAYIFTMDSFSVTRTNGKFWLERKSTYIKNGSTWARKPKGFVAYEVPIPLGIISPSIDVQFGAGELDRDMNWGESVEGMFAAGLCHVFREYVVPPGTVDHDMPLKPTSLIDDIGQLPQLYWLTSQSQSAADAQTRFRNIFIEPAKALASWSNPTTSLFIDAMRFQNIVDWPVILPLLKKYFMGFPEIKYVDFPANPAATGAKNKFGVQTQPTTIPAAGGPIEIYGKHFGFDLDTELYIGGTGVPFSFVNPSKITCVAPARPTGTIRDIILISPDGDDKLINALHYV